MSYHMESLFSKIKRHLSVDRLSLQNDLKAPNQNINTSSPKTPTLNNNKLKESLASQDSLMNCHFDLDLLKDRIIDQSGILQVDVPQESKENGTRESVEKCQKGGTDSTESHQGKQLQNLNKAFDVSVEQVDFKNMAQDIINYSKSAKKSSKTQKKSTKTIDTDDSKKVEPLCITIEEEEPETTDVVQLDKDQNNQKIIETVNNKQKEGQQSMKEPSSHDDEKYKDIDEAVNRILQYGAKESAQTKKNMILPLKKTKQVLVKQQHVPVYLNKALIPAYLNKKETPKQIFFSDDTSKKPQKANEKEKPVLKPAPQKPKKDKPAEVISISSSLISVSSSSFSNESAQQKAKQNNNQSEKTVKKGVIKVIPSAKKDKMIEQRLEKKRQKAQKAQSKRQKEMAQFKEQYLAFEKKAAENKKDYQVSSNRNYLMNGDNTTTSVDGKSLGKSPIHKLYQPQDFKQLKCVIEIPVYTEKVSLSQEDNILDSNIVKASGTGPQNAIKNTQKALRTSAAKPRPSTLPQNQQELPNQQKILANNIYDHFVKRRVVPQGQPTDLGVLSLDQVAYHAFKRRIISEEIYTEFIAFSTKEKILKFLNLFTQNRLNEWNFNELKITIIDHRRLSELLVALYPKKYKIGEPLALNKQINVFLKSMYDLTSKGYQTMLTIIDELSRIPLWHNIRIKCSRVLGNHSSHLSKYKDPSERPSNLQQQGQTNLKRPIKAVTVPEDESPRSNSAQKAYKTMHFKKKFL